MLELCGLEEEIFLQVDKNRRLEPPDFVYVVKYINPQNPTKARTRNCRRLWAAMSWSSNKRKCGEKELARSGSETTEGKRSP